MHLSVPLLQCCLYHITISTTPIFITTFIIYITQYQYMCVRVEREGIYFCIYFTFSLSHQCALEASAYTYYCILFSVFSFCVCIRLSYCMVCSVCCVSSFYSFFCVRECSLQNSHSNVVIHLNTQQYNKFLLLKFICF